jgi:hypothetical protein
VFNFTQRINWTDFSTIKFIPCLLTFVSFQSSSLLFFVLDRQIILKYPRIVNGN